MKCREKNPGNPAKIIGRLTKRCPSMKCREKNPGNSVATTFHLPLDALNEVPGKESRQCFLSGLLPYVFKSLNEVPGKESRQ